MSKRETTIVITFLLLLGSIVIVLFENNSNLALPYPKHDCANAENIEQCNETYYKEYAEKFGTIEALHALELDRSRDPTLKRDCHNVMHQIGHVAAVEYKTMGRAFQAGNNLCGNGYYHGVVEILFEHEDFQALTPQRMESFCAQDLSATSSNFLRLNCIHGIGHALMDMSHGDIVASLFRCGEFSTDPDRSQCATGVIMEEGFTVPKSSSTGSIMGDPTIICSQALGNQEDCWLSEAAMMIAKNDPAKNEALRFCAMLNTPLYRKDCEERIQDKHFRLE